MLTLDQIIAHLYPHLPARVRADYTLPMEAAFVEFGITTKLRAAAVLAQLAVESRELTHWEENLNYSARRLMAVWPRRFPTLAAAAPYAGNPKALAEMVYGGRMGNTHKGDGYTFRGRSPVDITGRSMYEEIGQHLSLPLVENPDLANDPQVAFRIVGCFFRDVKHCLQLADRRQFKALTEVVNGGLTDWAARLAYYEQALSFIPDGWTLADAEAINPAAEVIEPDLFITDVHEPIDDDEQAAASEQTPTPSQPEPRRPPAPTPTRDIDPSTSSSDFQATQEAAPDVSSETVSVQRVAQSWGSKLTAWWPMVSAPLLAAWAAYRGMPVAAQTAVVGLAVVGLVTGAWLWNESKKRQAAQQHALIDAGSSRDRFTVAVRPAPPEAVT